MANIPAKLATVNKYIGLCLQACKRYKGKGLVHFWTKQALYYLLQAKYALKEGMYTLYRFYCDMAKRRINYANHELFILKAF